MQESVKHSIDLVGFGECLIEMSDVGNGLYRTGFAGDVLNTLFYASRLGLRTGLVSCLGTDHFTEDLLGLLNREDVNLDPVSVLLDRSNGLYIIRMAHDGAPQYSFWRSASAARELFVRKSVYDLTSYVAQSNYFLFSAIALAIVKERPKLFELLDGLSTETVLLFDANVRAALWEDLSELASLIEQLAKYVKVLFVTDSDDQAIYGERPYNVAIDSFLKMGFGTVIYRRGANGCIVANGSEVLPIAAVRDVEVVDSTGAGDGFNAGFIFGLRSGMSLVDCGTMGNAVAACTLSTRGGLAYDFTKAQALANFGSIQFQRMGKTR